MSAPFFEIGEEVIMVTLLHPELNGDYTITAYRAGNFITEDSGKLEFHHGYKLSGIDYEWFSQCTLRKKPKPAQNNESFFEMITWCNTRPETVEVENV